MTTISNGPSAAAVSREFGRLYNATRYQAGFSVHVYRGGEPQYAVKTYSKADPHRRGEFTGETLVDALKRAADYVFLAIEIERREAEGML